MKRLAAGGWMTPLLLGWLLLWILITAIKFDTGDGGPATLEWVTYHLPAAAIRHRSNNITPPMNQGDRCGSRDLSGIFGTGISSKSILLGPLPGCGADGDEGLALSASSKNVVARSRSGNASAVKNRVSTASNDDACSSFGSWLMP